MKTILLATDFSANADNAARYLLELNKFYNARILLLHTYETPVLYSDVSPFTVQLDFQVLHNAAAKKLHAFYKKHFEEKTDLGLNVEMLLERGLASSRICEIAAEKKADLIVMGSTGTGAAERFILGSNAQRVAMDAHCKVLLVPRKAKFDGLDKIIFATDLSEDNLSHASEVFPLAKKFNAELLFLFVDSSVIHTDLEIKEIVSRKIKKRISYPKKSAFVATDPSAAEGVNIFLKKQKADCLVIYHRHRSLFISLFRPSKSKNILVHSSVPVLVIHEDDFA